MTTSEKGLEIIISGVLKKLPEIPQSRFDAIKAAIHPLIPRDTCGRIAVVVDESRVLSALCHLMKTRPVIFKEIARGPTPLERLKAHNAGRRAEVSPASPTKKATPLERLKQANRGQH